MICPVCETNEAVVSLVMLEDYTTQQFCAADFARFALDFAKSTLPADEILDVLGIPQEGFAAEAPQEPQNGPSGRKRGRPKDSPEPPPEPAPGPPEVAAAPADE